MDQEGALLYASNLGDSGFIILRKDKIIFKSPPQQYQFNFPYQLGYDTSVNNSPDQADDFCISVQPGDVIVTGTDGLWDNLFMDECARLVTKCRKDGLNPSECSQKIAQYAQRKSLDSNSITPFQLGAQKNGYAYYGGGKPDDVTVVVSYVTQGNSKL